MLPRTTSRERGANAIEFAMTLPFFLMMVVGIMDYGYLFMNQAGLDNAVSTACRAGAITDPDYATPKTIAKTTLDSMSAMFCNNGTACTNTVNHLETGIYVIPNETLECKSVRNIAPLVGFVPYPAKIQSISYYRLEWQEP